MSNDRVILENLPEHEQCGLTTMAMYGTERSRSAIARTLHRFGIRVPGGKGSKAAPPNATNMLPILRRWSALGWVHEAHAQQWGINARAQHEVLSAAARSEVLERAYQACVAEEYYSSRRGLLDARRALYQGDADTLLRRLRGYSRRGYDEELLEDLIPPRSPGAAIALLPVDVRTRILDQQVREAIEDGVGPDDDLLVAVDGVTDDKNAAILASMHELYTLAGREAPPSLLDETTAAAHEAIALGHLIRGDFDEARASCRTAWAMSVGPRKTRKNRLETAVAPLLTLMLACGSSEERTIAIAQMTSPGVRKDEAESYLLVRSMLDRSESRLWHSQNDWQSFLILTLVVGWLGRHLEWTSDMSLALAQKTQRLDASGFGWAARQLASAAVEIGADIPNERASHPLTKMGTRKEPWEIALDAIETELDTMTTSPRVDTRAERLVWEVELHPENEYRHLSTEPDEQACGHLYVTPRLQKRTKKGWTKGRPVALQRLAAASLGDSWVTQEDLRVTAHIVGQRDYYGSVSYMFDEAVANAMIDHPRAFWFAEDETSVTVVAGRPSLRVERSGGRVRVRFHPRALATHALICEKTGENRLVVYNRSDAPERLLEIVGRQLDLPEAAVSRVERLVARIAPFVAVHSDVDAAEVDAEDVDADPRPVIELARRGSGLQAEIVVLPLGADGPRARAGEGAPAMLTQIDGRTVRCRRDLAEEKRRRSELFMRCPTLRPHGGGRAIVEDLLDCLELLEGLEELGDRVIVHWREGDRLSVAGTAGSSGLRLTMATADEWFSTTGELEVDEALVVDLQQLLENLPRRTGRFVPLDAQRFIALTADLETRLETLHAARVDDQDQLNLHPIAASVVAGWADDVQMLKLDRSASRRLKKAKEAYKRNFEIPGTLDADLRDYQREGVLWMLRLAHWGAGACLADDMGLGKTVQALAVLLDRAPHGPALVVAPTSVCSGWLEQAGRFAPSLRTTLLASSNDVSVVADLGAFDVAVCSYAVMTRAIDHLAKMDFTTVVLDEAQAIKNPATRRAKAACRLRGAFRITTTGTPVENRLSELWSLMRFLNPGFLGSAELFDKRFSRPVQIDGDERALGRLRSLVGPFVLRRNKRDVLSELPPRTEVTLDVQPSAEEHAFIEALRRNALQRINASSEGPAPSAISVLAELTRLRLAACDPGLVEGGETIASSKIRVFGELVEGLIAGGHRALVFSQFVSFLDRVRVGLDKAKIRYQYLDGATPAAARTRAVDAFQTGEGDLFLISLKAGGTGLNLTAADYVIHLDPWWNPAVEDQASDRAHRIGQTRPVTVYRLVTKGTVEERVLALHHDKRELASQLLSGQDQVRPLNAEALLALITDL